MDDSGLVATRRAAWRGRARRRRTSVPNAGLRSSCGSGPVGSEEPLLGTRGRSGPRVGRRAYAVGRDLQGMRHRLGPGGLESRGDLPDGSGVDPDEPLTFQTPRPLSCCSAGSSARTPRCAFAPEAEPILWPEHFDVGLAVDEVNYGGSPGDVTHANPYAYVGPWTTRG